MPEPTPTETVEAELQQLHAALSHLFSILATRDLSKAKANEVSRAVLDLIAARREIQSGSGRKHSSQPELRRESIEEWNARHASYAHLIPAKS
ncbi:MAG: hypothetical protein ACRD04_05695 [Terriglobales bacterium]